MTQFSKKRFFPPLRLLKRARSYPGHHLLLIVIVDNGQSIRFFVFLHKIEKLGMVIRILNLEGHQYCMIGSKVTTILTTFYVHE